MKISIFLKLTILSTVLVTSQAYSSNLPASLVLTKAGGCKSTENSSCPIWVEGQIDDGMASSFETVLRQLRKTYGDLILVYLNSEGGDVSSAIKIGQILRNDPNHAVFVNANKKCFSACVFILAGGTQRFVEGSVGIHRPYYQEITNLPLRIRQQRYKELTKKSKSYFGQMNIRENLMDAMTNIPPEQMKVLSNTELSYYGLNRDDPVFEEMKDDILAKRFGLSKFEYLRRKTLVNQRCANASNPDACMSLVMSK